MKPRDYWFILVVSVCLACLLLIYDNPPESEKYKTAVTLTDCSGNQLGTWEAFDVVEDNGDVTFTDSQGNRVTLSDNYVIVKSLRVKK